MHRAGFSKTRSLTPLQNPAKADNQKCRKPARMVYYSMLGAVRAVYTDYALMLKDNINSLKSYTQ
jgi:spore germination protein YaaH